LPWGLARYGYTNSPVLGSPNFSKVNLNSLSTATQKTKERGALLLVLQIYVPVRFSLASRISFSLASFLSINPTKHCSSYSSFIKGNITLKLSPKKLKNRV